MDRFKAAADAAAEDVRGRGIGQLGEKMLHLMLKYYFAPDPETHERPLGGFIADAVTGEGVIEVQTRGLSRLKPKLSALLPLCPVTVVHPVTVTRHIRRFDENGVQLSYRKSPKHESVYTAMREVYTLRDFLLHENLRICLCDVETDDLVVDNGRQRKRADRIPIHFGEIRMLHSPADYAALLPDLPEPFTVRDLMDTVCAPEMYVRIFLSTLIRVGVAAECGKNGRMKAYRRLL